MRVGIGYDVHRLVKGSKLIIGGVEIEYEKGLLGHSDADVLIHAIIDAIFGAAALGDIGMHFPDTDRKYKGISSIVLLEKTAMLLKISGYAVNNIDATVIAEKPKMSPYIGKMRENISGALDIGLENISIKAKTEEGLGFTGNEDGISSIAVASICKNINEIGDD